MHPNGKTFRIDGMKTKAAKAAVHVKDLKPRRNPKAGMSSPQSLADGRYSVRTLADGRYTITALASQVKS
jgi:hypothetical protein